MSPEMWPFEERSVGDEKSPTPTSAEILRALADADTRSILQATSSDPQTAGELADQLDIKRTTLYRKLEWLTELAFLQATCRLKGDGHHTNQYRRTFDGVSIDLSDEGGVASLEDTSE